SPNQPSKPSQVARALPLSLSTQWGRSIGASFPSPARSLFLPVLRTHLASRQAVARTPLSSLSLRRGPALSVSPFPFSPWTGACALAHVVGFLGHGTRPHT